MFNTAPKTKYLIISLFSFAFFLRLFHLSHESIWLDEGISIAMAKMNVNQMMQKLSVDSMPPLHYYLLHYWMKIFGDSEFSVRFLSLVFSMATWVVSFLLSKKIYGEKVALWLGLFLAISVFHIEYAQEARNYSMISFFSISALYCVLKWKQQSSFLITFLFVICNVLLLYTHLLGVFWLIALNLYFFISKYLLKEKNHIKLSTWLIAQFIIALCFVPWIKMMLSQWTSWNQEMWMPLPSLRDIAGTLISYSGSVLLLLLFSFLIFKSFSEEKETWIFSVFFLIVPTLSLLLFCFVFNSIYLQKYTIASSLLFLILAAAGMEKLNEWKIQRLVLIGIVAFSTIKLGVYYFQPRKEQWRTAVAHIEKNAKTNEVVLIDAGYCIKNAYQYYAKRKDLRTLPLVPLHEEINEKNVTIMDSIHTNAIWLVLSHSRDIKGLVKKKISKNYDVMEHRKHLGVEVYKISLKR